MGPCSMVDFEPGPAAASVPVAGSLLDTVISLDLRRSAMEVP